MQRSPLDSALLSLGDEQISFFKAQTGIDDDEQLKQHLMQVRADAYDTYPFPCIRRFLWTNLTLTRLPAYKYVLDLGKSRENAIFLEVGCCFGHDIRTLIADGYPSQNVVALDLHRRFWDLGHRLFKSTPATFPVPFIEGNIFDDVILDMSPECPTMPTPSLLHLGNSLTPLRGHVSVVHASLFFHLFSQDEQLQIGHRLGALLSPLPGSIIFGHHMGLPVPGIHTSNLGGTRVFCHSPETWRALWDGGVFEKGTVEVDVELVPSDAIEKSESAEEPDDFYGNDSHERWRAIQWLKWSVKRI